MARFQHVASSLLAALWFGSLSAIGFMAVPRLFALLPTATAGQTAAQLFAAQGWMSVACTLLLLILFRGRLRQWADAQVEEAMQTPRPDLLYMGLLITGLLLAMVLQWAVAPRIAMRQNLGFWHPLGTTLYVAQWLCALVAVSRLALRRN